MTSGTAPEGAITEAELAEALDALDPEKYDRAAFARDILAYVEAHRETPAVPAPPVAAALDLASDPLILSPDEFTAVKTVAAVLGLPGSASEPDGPATEATQTPEAIRDLEARFREAVAKRGPLTVLPSDRWQERAESAEARLVKIGVLVQDTYLAEDILAIIGSEEKGADRG